MVCPYGVSHDKINIATLLLDAGAKVDARNLHDQTALMWAAGDDNNEMVVLLLKHGARVNDRSSKGETALNMAQSRCMVVSPQYHEKRIADAEKRLETCSEEYKEDTRRRIEYYKKQYSEADTSDEAQQRTRRIVEMMEKSAKEHEQTNL